MATRVVAAGVLLSAAMALGVAGCSASPRERPIKMGPVDTGPGTLTSARKYLEGRWTLQSFEVSPPGGEKISLSGAGTLLYDDMSNLKMDIRTDETTAGKLRKAGIDIRDGVISTEGRTVIDLQNRTLTYVLEGQSPQIHGPLSIRRPRHWVVDGDTLMLTIKDDGGNPVAVSRWTRGK